MTAPRCNGRFERVSPAEAAALDRQMASPIPIDPMDFGGRLEVGGTGGDDGEPPLGALGGGWTVQEQVRRAVEGSVALAEAVKQEMARMRDDSTRLSVQVTMILERYSGIARRIEREVLDVLAKLPPGIDPTIVTSLRVTVDLLSLIQQAGAAGTAAAGEAGR